MQLVAPGNRGWVSMQALGKLELRPELGASPALTPSAPIASKPIHATARYHLSSAGSTASQRLRAAHGLSLELGGAVEQESQATGDLAKYVLLTLTVACLVLLFRSTTLAALLVAVALLSVGLGLLATWIAGFPFSFNTLLGTLGLVGLAFNNSIVVLAAIRANPGAGGGDADAIVAAVMASTRHIVSITLTTIGGFLPLLIFVKGDFWQSLSVVLAGGRRFQWFSPFYCYLRPTC